MSDDDLIRPKVRKTRDFPGGIGGDSQIRTPCGVRRAEMVRPGDLIVTRTSGLQPVRMVWARTLCRADMDAASGRAPVRLKPRALGPMMPMRELLVAGDHRVMVPGYRISGVADNQSCLMPANELAGASDAAFADRNSAGVTLYTFVFDRHEVFCASGLPVESFLPSPMSLSSLTGRLRNELVALFPGLRKDPASYPAAKIPEATGQVMLADAV